MKNLNYQEIPDNKKGALEPNSPENSLSKPEAEKLIENYIKSKILLMNKIDEGHDAIISKIHLNDLPGNVAEKFYSSIEQNKPISSIEQAVFKTFKIYKPGLAKNEAEIHQKACEILKAVSKDNIAQIPDLYQYAQYNISDDESELEQKLKMEGVDIKDKKFDVMIMDYIEGEDLGSYLYKEVILRADENDFSGHPELTELRKKIQADDKSINFEQLQKEADKILSPETEEELDDRTEDQKIMNFLRTKKFFLKSEKIRQLSEALDILHVNGIYHRDLHSRNIMVNFDSQREIKNYFIIDLGAAINIKSEPDSAVDPYKEDDRIYPKDQKIIETYKDIIK